MFQVAIAGFGRTADIHLEAWWSVDGAFVTAIADDSPLARERARSLGMDAYDSIEQLVSSRHRLDAISICTPTVFHTQQALAAMSMGIPVLCEAPCGISPECAQRLLDGARQHRVPFQVAAKFRHLPEVRKARYLIRNGAIGSPLFFRLEMLSEAAMEDRWESNPRISGGGAWANLGFHAADLIGYLLSPVAKAQGTELKARQKLAVEDSAMFTAHTECGATGTLLTSWSLRQRNDVYLSIEGSEGRIDLGWKHSFLYVDGEAPVELGAGFSEVATHLRMMRMFQDLCLGGDEIWIAPEEVLCAAMVVEAGYRSMQSGRWTQVPAVGIRPKLAAMR